MSCGVLLMPVMAQTLNFPNKLNEYLCLINKEHEEGVLKS
jgi:hypothetical protein